jgi:hypothetical protein
MDSEPPSSPAAPPTPTGAGRRPPRPPGRRRRAGRTPRLTACLPFVRIEPSDLARLKSSARAADITLSAYIRRAVFDCPLPRPVPAINREAWARLGALGASFNQHVRAIQEGRAHAADRGLLEELRQEIAALRRELIGEVEDVL